MPIVRQQIGNSGRTISLVPKTAASDLNVIVATCFQYRATARYPDPFGHHRDNPFDVEDYNPFRRYSVYRYCWLISEVMVESHTSFVHERASISRPLAHVFVDLGTFYFQTTSASFQSLPWK